MQSLTPVIFVDGIEPCLAFWEFLGFEKTMEVPEGEGDKAGFVAMQRGTVAIMYQSRASLREDLPVLAEGPLSTSGISLYLKVNDLEDVKRRLRGAPLLFPERTTFYGAREIGARAPCGTAVVFAEFSQDDDGSGEPE